MWHNSLCIFNDGKSITFDGEQNTEESTLGARCDTEPARVQARTPVRPCTRRNRREGSTDTPPPKGRMLSVWICEHHCEELPKAQTFKESFHWDRSVLIIGRKDTLIILKSRSVEMDALLYLFSFLCPVWLIVL